MVERIGDRRREEFRDPEGVPHPHGIQEAAEHKGHRQDEQRIPQQGDHQGGAAHAQALQRAAGNDGNRRYHKADTDDAQGGAADGDGFRAGGEQPDELAGDQPAQNGAHRHDAGRKGERHTVDLFHPGGFFCAVIVADHRPHTLDDPVGGQIQEGLQFVIHAQHQNIDLGIGGKNDVQAGDQQGGQRQIQGGGNSDGVHFPGQARIPGAGGKAKVHREIPRKIAQKIDRQAEGLPDAGGKGGTLDAHFREGAPAENQNRV